MQNLISRDTSEALGANSSVDSTIFVIDRQILCAASTWDAAWIQKARACLRAAQWQAGCILFLGRCRILTRTLEASSWFSLSALLWRAAASLIPAIEHGSAAFCYSRQAIRVAFNCIKQQPIHPTCGPADTWSNFSLCLRLFFLFVSESASVCLMKPPKRDPRTTDRRLCQFCLIALTHLAGAPSKQRRSCLAPLMNCFYSKLAGWHAGPTLLSQSRPLVCSGCQSSAIFCSQMTIFRHFFLVFFWKHSDVIIFSFVCAPKRLARLKCPI